MNNKVYFEIENKKLYLDYMLEQHDYVPLFYVCKDEFGARYVVLCSDFEEETYLIVKVSLVDLRDMLYGRIDIRSIFLKQTIFWKVSCSERDFTEDVVEKFSIESFPIDCLPVSGECYVLFDEEHKQYAGCIADELHRIIDDIKVYDVGENSVGEGIVCDQINTIYEMIEDISLKICNENRCYESIFFNEDIGLYAA